MLFGFKVGFDFPAVDKLHSMKRTEDDAKFIRSDVCPFGNKFLSGRTAALKVNFRLNFGTFQT